MKTTLTALLLSACLLACGGPELDDTTDENDTPVEEQSLKTPVVGVQDGSYHDCDGHDYSRAAGALDSPLWDPLNVHTVRATVRWDIAYYDPHTSPALAVEQACFNYWLAAVAKQGLTPEVSFAPDHSHRSSDGKIRVPDINTYDNAMKVFIHTYSCPAATCSLPPPPPGVSPYPAGTGPMARVSIIAPWGEPDFPGPGFYMPQGGHTFDDPGCGTNLSVDACGPVLAAQMWVKVKSLCPTCTVIAGDFSSQGGLQGTPTYLQTYSQHLNGQRPPVWGLHPYSDVWRLEDQNGTPLAQKGTITYQFSHHLRLLGYRNQTHIWFDEVSAFYNRSQRPHPYGKELENLGANYLMKKLAVPGGVTDPGEPIVTRLYYLNFQNGLPDFSLVVHGQPYPPYWTIRYRNQPQQ